MAAAKRRRTDEEEEKQLPTLSVHADAEEVADWLGKKYAGQEYGAMFLKEQISGATLRDMPLGEFRELFPAIPAEVYYVIKRTLSPAAGAAAAAGAAPEKPEVTKDDFCDLGGCKAPKSGPDECPNIKLVGIRESVKDCVKVVNKKIEQETSETGGCRVEPLMISRSWRGGKTRLLCKLFDKLKRKGYNPIFVTFNSSGPWAITRDGDENLLDTLLRGIAWGLMKEGKKKEHAEKKDYKVIKATIVDYLKDENVVLLVDELSALIKQGMPKEEALGIGDFLRKQFLDPKGRHLVFTTHMPRGSATKAVLGESSAVSERLVKVVDPPRCEITESNLDLCRRMDAKLDALSVGEMAYHSGIPSLIYSVKVQDFKISGRFSDVNKPDAVPRIAKFFINEFLSGDRSECEALRTFDCLTLCPEEGKVEWILGYAQLMCEGYLRDQHDGFKQVGQLLGDLQRATGKVGDGAAWEHVVNIAIILRCLKGLYTRSWHAHLPVGDTAEKPRYVLIKDIPGKYKTPEAALQWWQGKEPSEFPYVVVLIPKNATFKTVDTLVVYKQSKDTKPTIHGFQQKAGREIQTRKFSAGKGQSAKGILMRGLAPDERKARRADWLLVDKKEVEEFVGASLKCVIPDGKFTQ